MNNQEEMKKDELNAAPETAEAAGETEEKTASPQEKTAEPAAEEAPEQPEEKKEDKKDEKKKGFFSKKNEIEELKTRISELEGENVKLKNEYLKAYADTENTRRRLQQEAEATRKYRIQSFALDILPVLEQIWNGRWRSSRHRKLKATAKASK